MKLYLTDEHGRKYECDIESEETIIDNRTFGEKQNFDRLVHHTLTITADVGEVQMTTTREKPAQQVIEELFTGAKEQINRWNNV